jgi:glutamyl-tRNA synthetase/glutamyl-Q tRNA(Asp) synthetase
VIVSRFAPAPTGLLHLGHVLNALHVWGLARARGGRVLLRIEDHDRQRCRGEFEAAILDDLEWLGFAPDEPPIAAFRHGRCDGRQSDRHDVYGAMLARLHEQGLIYACDCSRRALRAEMASGDGAPMDAELRYSGRCAGRRLEWGPGRGLRVRLPASSEHFDDLRHGPQRQRPWEQCGDLLVKDRDGNWTYQFAVTVDDLAQGVNLVIRGDDLLSSTGRQLQLSRLLGRQEPPRFLHHALIMKTATQKLSKADRDTSVRDLRRAGVTREDVFGRALAAAGLVPSSAMMDRRAAEDLIVARYAERTAVMAQHPPGESSRVAPGAA